MRLTCGFEIIMSRKGGKGKKPKDKNDKEEALDTEIAEAPSVSSMLDVNDDSPEWKTFLDSLKRNGFFQCELEGSKKWKELMVKARQFYRETIVEKEKEEVKSHSLLIFMQGQNLSKLICASGGFFMQSLGLFHIKFPLTTFEPGVTKIGYKPTILLLSQESAYVSDEIKEKVQSILSSSTCAADVAAIRAEEADLEPGDVEDWMTIDPKVQ